jgi:thioredoxin reductase (NADPH)
MQKKVFDLEKQGKIKIAWDTSPVEFVGEAKLEKVKLKNTKTEESSEMPFDGAFVAIGHIPSTKIFGERLELDEKGYVVVHNHTRTNIKGVFVAGDVHDYHYKQAVTAAGFGCMAAMDALKYLDDLTSREKGKGV